MEESCDPTRRYLKILLLHLAAKSEHPSKELQAIIQEVLVELKEEVARTLANKRHLRIISTADH